MYHLFKTSPMGNKYEAMILPFNRTNQEYFEIRSLRENAAVQSRKLSEALTNDDIEKNVSERALSIIIPTLGNNPRPTMQHFKIAKKCLGEIEKQICR